ncbi:MAG TPA: type IV secretion system protein TraC, partial [Gammaproteobacteria bacterium]|nr:type IV secretion system protein TraC [Gammaproteobacteria bacterium]
MFEQLVQLGNRFTDWVGDRTKFGTDVSSANTGMIDVDWPVFIKFLGFEGYDPHTDIYYNKKSRGFLFEVYPLLGANEETENILTSLITDILPVNTDLQFVLWGSPKIGDTIDQFQIARSKGDEIFAWLAKKRGDFLKGGSFETLSSQGSFILRNVRLFIVISENKKFSPVYNLITVRDDIINLFKSLRVPSQDITINEFISMMTDMLYANSSVYPTRARWNPYDSLAQQITDQEAFIRVYKDRIEIENDEEIWEARSLSVKSYPNRLAQWEMSEAIGKLFNDSLQMPGPFIKTLSIRLADHQNSIDEINAKTRKKEKDARSPLIKLAPSLAKEHADLQFMQQRLSEGDKKVKVYFQVVLFAKQEEANAAERKVRDLYRANGWQLKKTCYLQLPSYLAMLPMMVSEGMYEDMQLKGRLHTMSAFNSISIAPLQGEWKGTSTPALILPGCRGQIATWSPFDNVGGNYNMAVAATSGRGKTVFMQEYIVSVRGLNGLVWVIDVGRSYEKTCRVLKGEFIEFKPNKPICLNPFTTVVDIYDSLEILKPLFATMARPVTGASEEELAFIERAILAAWQDKRQETTVTDIVKWLNSQQEKHFKSICQSLAMVLTPYAKDGMYGKYFEGRSSIDLSNPFIILELQGLDNKKDLQRIVLLLLIYQINNAVYLGGRERIKTCIIDEAWALFKGNDIRTAEFIEKGYRTARRHKANFVTITQSIADYYQSPISLAAFNCSDFKVILGQTDAAINQIKKDNLMDMDGFTERLFRSIRTTSDYSEFIIKSNHGLSVHRLVLDPFSRILYSTHGDEFEMVNKLEKQGYSLIEAIEIVA